MFLQVVGCCSILRRFIMAFGQAYFAFKGVSGVVEWFLREVCDEPADEAKQAGRVLGAAVATGVAIATLDSAGGAATAAEIGSGERSLDL
jgi:hypothetical protein